MLRTSLEVFNDVIQGTTAVYTNPELNEPMGVADAVFLAAWVAQASGTSPTLTVTAETSVDGVNWGEWAGAPLINALALSTTTKTSGGSNGYFNNGARLMRLKVQLGGADPSALVRLFWIGRDFRYG
jgi:hypothetical protein